MDSKKSEDEPFLKLKNHTTCEYKVILANGGTANFSFFWYNFSKSTTVSFC